MKETSNKSKKENSITKSISITTETTLKTLCSEAKSKRTLIEIFDKI